jgi:hypothetical protein
VKIEDRIIRERSRAMEIKDVAKLIRAKGGGGLT